MGTLKKIPNISSHRQTKPEKKNQQMGISKTPPLQRFDFSQKKKKNPKKQKWVEKPKKINTQPIQKEKNSTKKNI